MNEDSKLYALHNFKILEKSYRYLDNNDEFSADEHIWKKLNFIKVN